MEKFLRFQTLNTFSEDYVTAKVNGKRRGNSFQQDIDQSEIQNIPVINIDKLHSGPEQYVYIDGGFDPLSGDAKH